MDSLRNSTLLDDSMCYVLDVAHGMDAQHGMKIGFYGDIKI